METRDVAEATVQCGPNCPGCIANYRRHRADPSHRYAEQPRRAGQLLWRSQLMKREKPPATPTKGKWSVPDKDWSRLYPSITTHLCDCWWDDGSPRETSSLTVRMGEAVVQISLTDYELKRTAFTSGDTFEAAMALMEDALTRGQCRFHPWKGQGGRPQRK